MTAAQSLVIGRIQITEPVLVRETFECAAWGRTLEVPPGEYEIHCYPHRSEGSVGHTLYARVPAAKVTDATFRSRLGAHLGNDDGPQEIGTVRPTTIQIATYKTGDGPLSSYGRVLLDGRVVEVHSRVPEGRSEAHHSIRLRERSA